LVSRECREAGPWAYPSRGNRCECYRVDHGLRRSQGVVSAACPSPVSNRHFPIVIVGSTVPIRQLVDRGVKLVPVPDDATVDCFRTRHTTILNQLIELRGGHPNPPRRL